MKGISNSNKGWGTPHDHDPANHGVSEAIYLRDTDNNGSSFIGIDRRRSGLEDGGVARFTEPLNLDDLLRYPA